MIRISLITIILVLFNACKTKGQENNGLRALKYFQEGAELMSTGLRSEFDDSSKAKFYFSQAIGKFEEAYVCDSTNLKLGIYLSWLYYKNANYHKALSWALKLQPYYTVVVSNVDSIFHSNNLKEIGFCYLNLGNLEVGIMYLNKALTFDSKYSFIVYHLIEIANRISNQNSYEQTVLLEKMGLNPCAYAVSILKYGKSLCNIEEGDFLFTNEKFEEIAKKCR